MTNNIAETLDVALQRLQAGESLTAILTDYPAQAEDLRPLLHSAASLESVRPIKFPAPQTLQNDRAAFITNIEHFQQQAVSQTPLIRLKEQVVHLFPVFSTNNKYGKEHRRMSTLLIKTAIVFSLLFGTMGGTAVMAANSLPDSPVYPLKLAMEQTQLALTRDPAQQGELQLALAQKRSQEMLQMALQGDVPPEETGVRLQQHLQQTMQLAGELPEQNMLGLLTQVQQMTQTQTQQMSQAQAQASAPAQAVLGQAFQYMNQVGEQAMGGIENPHSFQARFGKNKPVDDPEPVVEPTEEPTTEPTGEPTVEPIIEPTEEPTAEPTEEPTAEPTEEPTTEATGNQYNKNETPEPGQFGQNCAGDEADCEPVEPQSQHQQNQNLNPGQDCTESGECEPIGDEHKYGQDDTVDNSGPHNDNCTEPDCVPAGDENKFGQEPDPVPQPADNGQGQQNSGGGSDNSGGGNGRKG